jgi:hypothetical protein
MILLDRFSNRGLAEAMKWTFERDYLEVLHDVSLAESGELIVKEEDIYSVDQKLRHNGFEAWLNDHPRLV